MRRIVIGNFEFDVKVESGKVKHTYVRIKGKEIVVRTPSRISEEKAKEIAIEKLKKLELEKVDDSFLTSFLFFGRTYKLVNGRDFSINHKRRIISFSSKHKSRLAKYLEASLKRYAKNYLKRVYRRFGLESIPEVEIRRMSNKLGCLKNGVIFLSFYLSFFPKRLIRYVITHELLHYKINSHNVVFKHVISSIYPDYREIEKELKRFLVIVSYNRKVRIVD